MKTTLKFLRALGVLALAGLALAGCVSVPEKPGEILGDNLRESQVFRKPSAEDLRGIYEISAPFGVISLACKTFGDVRGNPVSLCRKAAKAWVDGKVVSAYPFGERWMVFSGKEPSRVEILTASGARVRVSVVGKVSQAEVGEILGDLLFTFNCESPPVEGVVYLYSDQECKRNERPGWLQVPGNERPDERAMTSGALKIQVPFDPISLGSSIWNYLNMEPNRL